MKSIERFFKEGHREDTELHGDITEGHRVFTKYTEKRIHSAFIIKHLEFIIMLPAPGG